MTKATKSDDAPTGANGQGIKEQAQSVSLDCVERIAVEQADKDFATLRAVLALHGFTVQIIGDNAVGTAYMVSRWAMHRTLPDLAGVREFANRVGVQHG